MQSKLFETPFGGLRITSDHKHFFDTNVLTHCSYREKISKEEYEISIKTTKLHSSDNSYRCGTFKEGLYLGHHMGKPGNLKTDENSVSISISNSTVTEQRKVLWSYALKFYFTVMAQRNNALHIKAATVLDKKNQAFLIIGRGGSGKTTLSKALKSKGMQILGNTHALIHSGKVWPISTWIRERDVDNVSTYKTPDITTLGGYSINGIICIRSWNEEDKFTSEVLSKEKAYSYLLYYSLATINYDLKEDLFDHYKRQEVFSKYIWEELENLQNFVLNNHCINIDWDCNGNKSISHLIGRLEDMKCT